MGKSLINKYRKFYIKNFIKTFLSKKYQSKWIDVLLEFDEPAWSDLSTWDFWDNGFVSDGSCQEWEGNLRSLTNHHAIKDKLNTICVVLRLGHDDIDIEDIMLFEIINSEIYILEGIVIIEPMKLALIINHDGGVCICESR